MSVKKIQVRLDKSDNANYLKIPLSLEFNSVGQTEVINRDFVSLEVEKSINPIIDYEKVRFTPSGATSIVDSLIFNLNFLKDGVISNKTYYSDIGFTNDDIKYKKNRFLNSFLRLSFYDSDVITNQNLVSFLTIYSKTTVDYIDSSGVPIQANKFPLTFKLQNPITKPEGFAEGFYLYHFRSDLTKNSGTPKYLYMRAEFNNASLGKTTKFITTNSKLPINELMGKLHVRYALMRNDTGFYYKMDDTYKSATNISNGTSSVTLNLYEIQVQ